VCRVHEETYRRLKDLKKSGESFSDVVERLLATAAATEREERHLRDRRVILVNLDDDQRLPPLSE
jgi:predicted CopG family antitoxin